MSTGTPYLEIFMLVPSVLSISTTLPPSMNIVAGLLPALFVTV